MTRHFGIPLSGRSAATGNPPPTGPLARDAVQTRTNIIRFPSVLPDSRAETREPFIQIREFATAFFLGCFVALVAVFFCIGFVGYRAFIA